MKYRSGLLGLLLALAVSLPAFAQDEDTGGGDSGAAPPSPIAGKPFYVSPMVSYIKADNDRGTKDGFGGTFAIGKKMTYGLNLELTGFFYQLKPENAAGGPKDNGTLKLSGVGVTAMIFPFSSYPGVYGLLSVAQGAGQNHPGLIPNYKTTVFDSGLGYLYPLTEKFILRAEARYHLDSHTRDKAGVQTPPRNNSEFYEGVFNLGLLIPLGEVQKAAPAPAEEAPPAEVVPTESLDSDNDGVPDDKDKCPGTPAGTVVNESGCPVDSDGDGVPDAQDECPNTPAGAKVLANGCALKDDCRTPRAGEQVDENGCAVDKAFILKGVNFEFDSDRLTEEAKSILDQVAETLKAYQDISVEIAGHTDAIGTDAYNLGLSERRAISVKNYLTTRGIEAQRMTPNGYGESQPIDTNDTEEGREKNRRVELRVIEEQNSGLAAPQQ